MTTFSDFSLNPLLLKALAEQGYDTPTPIQAQAIPSVMAGKDLQGIAQTGTGKTAAFALPILHRLAATKREPMRRGCRVLVLSPTRELATQIAESFRTYGRHLGVRVATVFGGVGHRPQKDALARGLDVLVATPGRLLDHLDERNVVLDGVEMFVLDEADQMLDMGFVVPIRRIVSKLSARRQSLFFSATMPKEIGRLAAELLNDPVRIAVTPSATPVERVRQQVYFVETKAKPALLVELFANPELTRALVFTRTKRGADRVARNLEAAGIKVAAIHGNKSQNQREAALAAFKASRIRALVATDVAARGIDIDLVSHVVNYELSNLPESYVHRIGRTARAGADGSAISFCDGEERAYLRDIERLTRQSIPSTDRRGQFPLPSGGAGERDGERRHSDRQPRHNGKRPERHVRPGSAAHRGRPQQAANGGGRDRPQAAQDRPIERNGERNGERSGHRRPAQAGAAPANGGHRAAPARPDQARSRDDHRNGRQDGGDRKARPSFPRSGERDRGPKREHRQAGGYRPR